MKIIVSHMGLVILEKDIAQGEHTVGRAEENSIRINHLSIGRNHGKVFYKDGAWFYQGLSSRQGEVQEKPQPINERGAIKLAKNIMLMTQECFYGESTLAGKSAHMGSESQKPFHKRIGVLITAGSLLLVFLVAAAFYFVAGFQKPMDAKSVFKYVRPKVVEFEFIKDKEILEDLKKYADLKEDDFMSNIGFCSGFIIAPEIVATAFHCIRKDSIAEVSKNFTVKTHDGKIYKPKRILGFDPKRDYLFIEVPDLNQYGHLKLSDSFKIGQKVYTFGNVEGRGIAIREGIMAGTTTDPDHPEIDYLRYSAAASPGNSGGPLVDEYGRVLAVVFARSWAENYNLGTSSKFILEGKAKFASGKHPQKIVIDTSQLLGVSYYNFLMSFLLPFPTSWSEHPELPRPLEKLTVEVAVPSDIEQFSNEMALLFHTEVNKTYEGIMESMDKANLSEGRWKSFLGEKTPFMVPTAQSNATNTFRLQGNSIYPTEIKVRTPITRDEYNYFVRKLEDEDFFSPTGLGFSAQEIIKSSAASKDAAGVKYRNYAEQVTRLSYITSPNLNAWINYGAQGNKTDPPNPLSGDKILEDILGDEGVLTYTHYIPFIRPKSHRQYTVKKFEGKHTEKSVTDSLDRNWKLYSYSFLGLPLDIYCIEMPQGYSCFSGNTAYSITSPEDAIQDYKRSNFSNYHLSEYIMEPMFWETDPLIAYLGAGDNYYDPVYSDVSLKNAANGSLELTLKTLGINYVFSKAERPLMLRIYGSLHGVDGNSAKWIATGFEIFLKDPEPRICGAGVNFKEQNISSLLHWSSRYSEESPLLEELSKEKVSPGKLIAKQQLKDMKPDIMIKSLNLKNWPTPVEIYGYCGKLKRLTGEKIHTFDTLIGLKPYNAKYSY